MKKTTYIIIGLLALYFVSMTVLIIFINYSCRPCSEVYAHYDDEVVETVENDDVIPAQEGSDGEVPCLYLDDADGIEVTIRVKPGACPDDGSALWSLIMEKGEITTSQVILNAQNPAGITVKLEKE